MDMIKRPRRLRGGEYMRKMVRETRMDKSSLIYPMFVQEGMGKEDESHPCRDSFAIRWTVCPMNWSGWQKQAWAA